MRSLLTIFILLLLSTPLPVSAGEPAMELDWDSMIPDDYRPDKIMAQFGDVNELEDDDPRALKIRKDLEEAFSKAPVVESLDGKRVRLPGYAIPLEGDGEKISEFLLVPYYGACVHVPPPPANQTVYVRVPKGDAKIRRAFDTVYVTGTLSAKPFDSEMATAGYQLEAEEVELYK